MNKSVSSENIPLIAEGVKGKLLFARKLKSLSTKSAFEQLH